MDANFANVFPGQRVITSAGTVRTVAFTARGAVYVYGAGGEVEVAIVRSDAWGGEADLGQGLGSDLARERAPQAPRRGSGLAFPRPHTRHGTHRPTSPRLAA